MTGLRPFRADSLLQAAARQRTFPPQDMVTVLVRFNRCLYAQLAGQPWEPPKVNPQMTVFFIFVCPALSSTSQGAFDGSQ